MTLVIDTASTSRRLEGDDLRRWAGSRTAFISSEMQELGAERAAVAQALRDLGMNVIAFEDLGGRDDDAVRAYLDGVARCDVYIGIVADRYGTMQASGRSPTHEEYLAARTHGRHISFWVADDGGTRQGNARDFVQEVQTFHTTGRFADPDDLARRVIKRIGELAADDEAPWIKLGEAVFRASVIRDHGDRLEIEAEVRDGNVAHLLETLRPDQWAHTQEAKVTTPDRSGSAQIERVTSETRSASVRSVQIEARVEWASGSGNALAAGTAGYSAEDLVEVGLRVGLLGEPIPEGVSSMSFLIDASDPLDPLPADLPESIYGPAARLLVVERLVGQGEASRITQFAVGPAQGGARALELGYVEAQRYSNVEPIERVLTGTR